MPEKDQPKFDKEIEVLKLNFVAEEWRGSLLMNVGVLLSAFITISVLVVASNHSLLGSTIERAPVVWRGLT